MFPVRLKKMISVASLVALAGCGSHGMSAMPQSQSASHAAGPAATTVLNFSDNNVSSDIATQMVGIRLTNETPFNSPKYGTVLGYFRGLVSTKSQIVRLTAASSVVFKNVDTMHPHTASFLGNATSHGAMFPAHFNGSFTQSAAGTAIGTTSFSTGILASGQKSLKYSTGSPGFYMFGCYFHYDPFGMRTVIIVQ